MKTRKKVNRFVILVTFITMYKSIQIFAILGSVLWSNLGFTQSKMYFTNGIQKQKIPFEFHHNLIIFPMEVNGIELNFILDTGASKTVIFTLNERDSLVLNNTQNVELRGLGTGEPIQAILSEQNNTKLGNTIGINQTIYMVYDEHFDFSSKVGMTVHGIIGYELLKNFVTTIDFINKQLILESSNHFKKPKNKNINSLNLTFHQNKPYLDCKIKIPETDEFDAKMLIDTGNSDALWVFENSEKGIVCPKPYFTDYLGEGLSGSIEGKRSKISSFQFGEFKFDKPTIAFLDSTATIYAKVFEERSGSIGNQIFNRFKIILDYPNSVIYLKKNKSFAKEFRYNRTGIELSYFGKILVENKVLPSEGNYSNENENGHIVSFIIDYAYEFKPLYGIYKIRKDSPADIAGLKVNDILYSIDGKLAHDFELEEINHIFQGDIGQSLTIQVDRNGIRYTFKLLLKDLL